MRVMLFSLKKKKKKQAQNKDHLLNEFLMTQCLSAPKITNFIPQLLLNLRCKIVTIKQPLSELLLQL